MKKFGVGDEVRAYSLQGTVERIVEGEVIEVRESLVRVRYYCDVMDRIVDSFFHKKQCRKVKKEEKKAKPPKVRVIAYIGRDKNGLLGPFSMCAKTLAKTHPTILRLVEMGPGECIIPIKKLSLPNETYITKERLFRALGNYLAAPNDPRLEWVWEALKERQ